MLSKARGFYRLYLFGTIFDAGMLVCEWTQNGLKVSCRMFGVRDSGVLLNRV